MKIIKVFNFGTRYVVELDNDIPEISEIIQILR